jgi:putative component of membrane protein insertase Oxa1/YidC/SpoIIIJ protein YidD
MRLLRFLWRIPRNTAVMMIGAYQATLSPDHGSLKALFPHGYCIYDVTCSDYAKNVLRERGLLIGSLLTIKRILSCNPWKQPEPGALLRSANYKFK